MKTIYLILTAVFMFAACRSEIDGAGVQEAPPYEQAAAALEAEAAAWEASILANIAAFTWSAIDEGVFEDAWFLEDNLLIREEAIQVLKYASEAQDLITTYQENASMAQGNASRIRENPSLLSSISIQERALFAREQALIARDNMMTARQNAVTVQEDATISLATLWQCTTNAFDVEYRAWVKVAEAFEQVAMVYGIFTIRKEKQDKQEHNVSLPVHIGMPEGISQTCI